MQKPTRADFTAFFDEMDNLFAIESDRGCVLMVSAYFEDFVRSILIEHCRRRQSDMTNNELNQLFKSFESQFSGFAACTRLARALGLITQWHQKVLLTFGPWRNSFAHGKGIKTITDDDVQILLALSRDRLTRFFGGFMDANSWTNSLGKSPKLDFRVWAIGFAFTLSVYANEQMGKISQN